MNGERRFRITDIIGNDKDYLGVENLQGSALVAGQMSLNYDTIPTLSVVSGRSVGIGAYLNRLGRRVIQTKDSPMILTGAAAINRLLGKEVYSSNTQLGGNSIMEPNGVTHWHARNDADACKVALRWLDFIPPVVDQTQCCPRSILTPFKDTVDRDVTFVPTKGQPYDPRQLVAGTEDGSQLGMFDKGSFQESLADWARTVVCGRAALGGTPCGVILVETRAQQKFDPADPADPTSSASFASQAGQVWYPDSARKTADALADFDKERLPVFIVANWRGFSGGMRDMFDEVMKFGASIVDNLRTYTAPVFIYIPPFGELRGGAWVVVDPVINHQGVVSMYADPTARGGILEPSGVVEIKFRKDDLNKCMERNHPELKSQDSKAQRSELLPVYRDAARMFADLHDTPGRMQAVGCISDVVPWKESRRFFKQKLTRKLKELELARVLSPPEHTSNAAEAIAAGIAALKAVTPEQAYSNDTEFLAWAEKEEAHLAEMGRRKKLESAARAALGKSKSVAGGDAQSLEQLCRELIRQGGGEVMRAMQKAIQSK